MRKALLLTLILLISAAWVVAQAPQSTPPANSSDNAQTSSDHMGSQDSQEPGSKTQSQMGKAGSENQIEGCLGGSSGNYTLTDSAGTSWQLQGDNSQLSKHLGQQVRISGMAASSSAASSAGAAATGQNFNVTKVRKIASTCSNTSSMPSK